METLGGVKGEIKSLGEGKVGVIPSLKPRAMLAEKGGYMIFLELK